MYYDKRHQRLNRFQGASGANVNELPPLKNKCSSSQKRKKSLEERSVKRSRVDAVTRQLGGLTGAANEFVEELDFHKEDDILEMVGEPGLNEEDDEYHSLLSQLAFSKLRPSRQKRFSWTDEADR